jgi:PAS domain S-box-containing protein
MYKGGASYTPHAANLIRYTGLIVPIILITYGTLGQLGLIDTERMIDGLGFFILSFWWLYIGIVQFLFPSKKASDSALRLIAYHLLAGGYLLFVTGIATPFVAFWILLLIASNLYFYRTGLGLSIIWFVLVVAVDIGFWYDSDLTIVAYDLVTLTAVLLSGIVTMSISHSHEADRTALRLSQVQESLQRDRVLTIVNNITDAIISTDKKGMIRMYNAATLNLLDTNDSLNGKAIDDVLKLVDQADKPVLLSEELSKTHGTTTRDDLNFSFADGEEIRLEVIFSPIRSSYSRHKKSETHQGYVLIMRDVTKAKSLEEERDEFISVVSHELRTPITIMEGSLSNLQLIMKQDKKLKKGTLEAAVTMAHDQSLYLAKMVNDLSTLSRAERGVADEGEDIDIRELVNKMHDEYHEDATKKKLHLNLDLGTTLGKIHVSRLYVEELLQNFITNSIKYTKTGSIVISAKQTKNTVTFMVKDTGIGISRSDQTKIFNKFYRSEDYRIRETSGTGLGLYVSAKLAHKLNTKIKLTSRLNHGSSFSFSLPVVSE